MIPAWAVETTCGPKNKTAKNNNRFNRSTKYTLYQRKARVASSLLLAMKKVFSCDFTFIYQREISDFVSLSCFMCNRIRTISFCFLLLFLVKGAVVFGLNFLQAANDPEKQLLMQQHNNDDAEKTTDENSFAAEEYTFPADLISSHPFVAVDPAVKITIRNTIFSQQVFLSAPEPPPDTSFL